MEILRKISSMISKSFKKLVNGMRRRESLTDVAIYFMAHQALEKLLLHKQ
jgi:hypothetical protein